MEGSQRLRRQRAFKVVSADDDDYFESCSADAAPLSPNGQREGSTASDPEISDSCGGMPWSPSSGLMNGLRRRGARLTAFFRRASGSGSDLSSREDRCSNAGDGSGDESNSSDNRGPTLAGEIGNVVDMGGSRDVSREFAGEGEQKRALLFPAYGVSRGCGGCAGECAFPWRRDQASAVQDLRHGAGPVVAANPVAVLSLGRIAFKVSFWCQSWSGPAPVRPSFTS